jgi:signal transduction histidine kinase
MVAPAFVGLACLAVSLNVSAIALLSVRADSRLIVLRLLSLAYLALLGLEALHWPTATGAPGLMFVPMMGLCGFLMDGPLLGFALWIGGLGVLAVAAWRIPAGQSDARSLLLMLGSSATACLASAWAWRRVLERALEQFRDWNLALREHWNERRNLATALFQEQLSSLGRLRDVLVLPELPAWEALRQELDHLNEIQARARSSRNALAELPLQPVDERDFSRIGLRDNLLIGLCGALSGVVVSLVYGGLSLPLSCFGAAFIAGMLLFLRRKDQPKRWLLRTVLVFGPVNALVGVLHDQCSAIYFWPFLILCFGILENAAAASLCTLLGALTLGLAYWHWDPVLGSWRSQAPLLLAVWVATLVVCLQALEERSLLLAGLSARGRELSRALRVRRRLLGMMHHDLASLHTALQGAADLGRAGLARTGDWDRVRRLLGRLGELLESGEEQLLGEQVVPPSDLTSVSVLEMAAAMQELYSERIAAKRLHLSLAAPADLHVRALPSLLRDSVLSNLVSNAVKFSQPGSEVALSAWQQGDQVALAVLDRGPGISAEALDRLNQGLEQPGSESGQGLGLLLAREQVQRLGGLLKVGRRAGGGTEAVIWLPLAPAS